MIAMDDMTIGQAREIAGMFGSCGGKKHPFEVGKKYLFCGIRHHTGRVVAVCGQWVKLEDVSWIVDTGRLSEMLDGKIYSLSNSEIEPSSQAAYINTDAYTEVFEWPHDLPKECK